MGVVYPNSKSLKLGVVLRRTRGATVWSKWAWKATSVLPGAPDASWKLMREEGDVAEFHATTLDAWLYVSDAEAYAHELQAQQPSVYVIMREPEADDDTDVPLNVLQVTFSPYEAQDYSDSGEEIVERVPMPPALHAWVAEFVAEHYVEEAFVKRRRDKLRMDRKQDGIGDARISQATDVYRAPRSLREAAE
ncbi:DUF3305 domain-containing protein [Roseobacter sp. EG26]|uniref:DUF3305 domain-containing protein n=1 Tax=Roseobacter sp. EG26 TaxID=3412477 RepID=UPI00261F00E1|nr:DUF3305 domain-containing protein [uncultured Roseobacter sp.]